MRLIDKEEVIETLDILIDKANDRYYKTTPRSVLADVKGIISIMDTIAPESLMTDRKNLEKEYDKIMKINYYLLRKYRSEIFREFGIPDDSDVETMRKIIAVFDMMYEEVQKEMPGMWYEYGFSVKEQAFDEGGTK